MQCAIYRRHFFFALQGRRLLIQGNEIDWSNVSLVTFCFCRALEPLFGRIEAPFLTTFPRKTQSKNLNEQTRNAMIPSLRPRILEFIRRSGKMVVFHTIEILTLRR